MKKVFKIASIVLSSLLPFPAAMALGLTDGPGDAKPAGAPEELTGQTGLFHTISNTLIYITGAVAVIVIIFGGLRYVTSTGDAARVKGAKDTILYGVVGLVVAILAYAIVNFVVTAIK